MDRLAAARGAGTIVVARHSVTRARSAVRIYRQMLLRRGLRATRQPVEDLAQRPERSGEQRDARRVFARRASRGEREHQVNAALSGLSTSPASARDPKLYPSGKIFPGLSRLSGSKACFTRFIAAMVSASSSIGRNFFFA